MNTRIASNTYDDALMLANIGKASNRKEFKTIAIGNIAGIMSCDESFLGLAEEDGVGLGAVMCRVHYGVFLTMNCSVTRQDVASKKDVLAAIIGRCLIRGKEMGAVRSVVGLMQKSDHCDDMKLALEDNGFRTEHVFEDESMQSKVMKSLGLVGQDDEDKPPSKNYVMSLALAPDDVTFERYFTAAKAVRQNKPFRNQDTSMQPSSIFGEWF